MDITLIAEITVGYNGARVVQAYEIVSNALNPCHGNRTGRSLCITVPFAMNQRPKRLASPAMRYVIFLLIGATTVPVSFLLLNLFTRPWIWIIFLWSAYPLTFGAS